MPTILVLFSSPADEVRLRVDREHRRIEQAIQAAGKGREELDRRHAATLGDLTSALNSTKYEVLHFSGHGSSSGLYLDTHHEPSGVELSAHRLAEIIKHSQSDLCALVLMSCYSTDTVTDLVPSAPYIVSVTGPADDHAAIEFVGYFYENYLRTKSVEVSYRRANAAIGDQISTMLTCRAAQDSAKDRLVVYSPQHEDPVYVDFTDARATIDKLDMSTEKFIDILRRKVRIHFWLFKGERDNAILPIGGFFAIFSWKNAKDIVHCHRIFRLKPDLPDETYTVIALLIAGYNDVFLNSYRESRKSATEQNPRAFVQGLASLHRVFQDWFVDPQGVESLGALNPAYLKTIQANCWANLSKADEKLAGGDPSQAMIFAEMALSSIHDAINEIVDNVSE